MRFTDQDAILCHRTTVFVADEFEPQDYNNNNNNQLVLRVKGFTEAKWAVASKSEDSYTKREAASVQGAQQ